VSGNFTISGWCIVFEEDAPRPALALFAPAAAPPLRLSRLPPLEQPRACVRGVIMAIFFLFQPPPLAPSRPASCMACSPSTWLSAALLFQTVTPCSASGPTRAALERLADSVPVLSVWWAAPWRAFPEGLLCLRPCSPSRILRSGQVARRNVDLAGGLITIASGGLADCPSPLALAGGPAPLFGDGLRCRKPAAVARFWAPIISGR